MPLVTEPSTPDPESDDALAELAAVVRIHPATARVRAHSPAELAGIVKPQPSRQPASPLVRILGSLAFSTLFHLILVAIALLVAGTAVYFSRDDNESPVIIADFDAAAYDPLNAALPVASDQPLSRSPGARSPAPIPDPPSDSLLAIADLGVIATAGSRLSASDFAPRGNAGGGGGGGTSGGVQFIGLRAGSNARDIIYVIDASGSMIPTFQFIVDELARSLDQLTEDQRFAVVFFQRNEALWAPPANTLTAATTAEKRRVIAWIREKVIPAGRSNPLGALESALAVRPQAIFLLSSNITGSGEFEIDQADLLAMLDRLNPANAESGARPVQINCLQFIETDPLGTLQKIAEAHGGPTGYRSVSRADLGLPEE